MRFPVVLCALVVASSLADARPKQLRVVAESQAEPRRTTKRAVVRKAGSTKARVIAKLPANTAVTIVNDGGEWTEIRARVGRKQITGFVSSDSIAPAVVAPQPAAEPPIKLTAPTSSEPRKTIEAVVVRQKPGEKEAIAGNLPAGTDVRIEGEAGRWMKVRAGDVTGFVMRTQLSGPTPATDTTAVAAPPPATTPPTRKWGKPDPDKPASDSLSVYAVVEAVLRSEGTPVANEIARVAKGGRLAVIDTVEVAGFIHVRDDDGREGYVSRAEIGNGTISSALATSAVTRVATVTTDKPVLVAPAAPIVVRRTLAVRLDAGIGFRVLGMDFTSSGGNGLTNYLASASAGAAEVDVDVALRSSRRLVIGLDAQLGASRSSPGIDYPGPSGPPGKVAFSTASVDAGLRIGMRARGVFEIAARAGVHYDVFVTSSLENVAMLPRESLLGSTLGARVEIAPPGSRVSATVHADALVFGRRRQTAGLEDGTDSTSRAVWAGVTARFAFGRRFAVLGAYDFGRATTEWSGMSTRDPGVTSARRVDSTQLVQVGLSIGL